MEKERNSLPPGLVPNGLPLVALNESDLDPVIAANLSGSFQNASHLANQEMDGDMYNMSALSQKSNGSLSFDVKKFSSRLSSHMSTFSDTLFSDIEDIEDITEPQVSNQEAQTENSVLLQGSTLKEVLRQHAKLNEGAIYVPTTSVALPRTKTPQPAGVTVLQGIPEEVTPTKSIQPEIDPLTPTANLKVLISAASPEIRNRERQKLNETGDFEMINTSFINSCGNMSDIIVDDNVEYLSSVDSSDSLFGSSKQMQQQPEEVVLSIPDKNPGSRMVRPNKGINMVDWETGQTEPLVSVSRKEKSLGLLCQRFLALYPDHPAPTEKPVICLDGVALHLGVERRRIYDIINVLESVDMVCRVGKNKYEWHGKSALHVLLANLKVKAENDGLRKRLLEVKERELTDPGRNSINEAKSKGNHKQCHEIHRKDKSLGLLCQKFLMLFLVSEDPRVINLDLSAKILIGDPDVDKTETGKFKTKIRRLYDIANILTSLELICKIHVTEVRGRKPAFKYTGPDPEKLSQMIGNDTLMSQKDKNEGQKKYITVQPSNIQSKKLYKPSAAKQVIQMSQTNRTGKVSKEKAIGARKSLTRHASFEQICQVAEQEFERELCHNPKEPCKVTSKSIAKGNKKVVPAQTQIPQTSSQMVSPESQVKPEPKTTVLNLTEDQLQDIIKMLSDQPENTQVCLTTGSSDRSPNLSSKDLLIALKKASNQQTQNVVTSDQNAAMVIKSECKSPVVNATSDSGYLSFTSGDSSLKSTRGTPSRMFLKRETNSVHSPRFIEIKKPKVERLQQDEFEADNEEVENEEPLDLSKYNILHEPPLAQGPDLEVASIIKESNNSNKMTKFSPLKSLNIGDTFSSNGQFGKTLSFGGLPKMPSLDCGLSSPLLLTDRHNQPGSQLNTPTFPVVSSGCHDGGSTSVFQFPTPGCSRIADANIKSLPTTPTYRLSCTSSPVMLLPSRPASFGGLTCPHEAPNDRHPAPPAVTVLCGHPVSVQKFSNILMTPTSDHLTTYKISPFTSTPTAPFMLPGSANKVLNHITPVHLRPCSGIRPSMNKMVNLVSVFAPKSDLIEQVPVSVYGNNLMDSHVLTNEIVPSSLGETCTTPVGPHLGHIGGVVTPGTFFSHTPGPELFSPVNLHDSVEFSGTSAFQSLKTTGKVNGSFIPHRKLSLPSDNHLM